MRKRNTITKEQLVEAIKDSKTMSQAAAKAGIAFMTFKRHTEKHGLYVPNQSGKGVSKIKTQLSDVFDGTKHMVTNHLRKRLIREGFKTEQCEECGITEWNGKKITFELDHVSGVRADNSLENLKILCPNCHSQTPTFRGRNIRMDQ